MSTEKEELELNTNEAETAPAESEVAVSCGEELSSESEKVESAAREDNAESDAAVPSEESVEKEMATVHGQPKKSKSRLIWNIILIALIGLGIYSLFGIVDEIGDESGASFLEVFGNANPWFMLLLVGVVLMVMVLDCSKFCIINKTVTGKVRFSSSMKTSFLGKYYDGITPFSTGGQPMQIYYLNSKKISGGNSTAIVFIRYFSSVFTWTVLGSVFMIIGTVNNALADNSSKTLLLVLGWVGVAVNLMIPAFITFFLLFPKFMYKLTYGFVRLGKKMRIVKDEEATIKKATKVVDDFRHCFKVMATTPFNLILLIVVSFAEAFLTFSVPYFVMKGLSCDVEGQLITVMALNAFVTFGVSFIPTPGNSGFMEAGAGLAFISVAGSTLSWSVVLWRFAVYYVYIIIGLIISLRDIIKKNIIKRRDGKKPSENG